MEKKKIVDNAVLVGLAQAEMLCDSCKQIILVGQPFQSKTRTVRENDGALYLVTETECMKSCSEYQSKMRAQFDAGSSQIASVTKPTGFVQSTFWDDYPLVAGPVEQELKIVTRNSPYLIVAIGYQRIVTMETSFETHKFLEVSSEQIQAGLFRRSPAEDSWGKWVEHTTENGFRCREYYETSGVFSGGMWYLHQSHVKPQGK